jgi:histidine triad (HIT) family protein
LRADVPLEKARSGHADPVNRLALAMHLRSDCDLVKPQLGAAMPTSRGCTFCDLIHGAGEVSVCYEDADAIAFMDIQPVNPGHVLVVPKQHHESLLDIPHELAMHLFEVAMQLGPVVRRVSAAQGTNIVVSSGRAAGQDVFHYHVHLIPRRVGDGFEVQLPFGGSSMPDRTQLDACAARIISELRDPVRHKEKAAVA